MTLLLDQCVPRKYFHLLKKWGYKATLLNEHVSPTIDDPDVLALAKQLDAVLLTVDMDFSNIKTYPPQNYNGIVVMRYQAQDEEKVSLALRQALEELYPDKLKSVLVVIKGDRYVIRRE